MVITFVTLKGYGLVVEKVPKVSRAKRGLVRREAAMLRRQGVNHGTKVSPIDPEI